MTTHQNRGAFDQAATQHPVKLLHTGADAGLLSQADFVQAFHFRQTASVTLTADAAHAFGAVAAGDAAHLADGVPGLAGRTLALPFGIVSAALGADEGGFGFCHYASFLYFMRLGCMADSPLRFLKSAS